MEATVVVVGGGEAAVEAWSAKAGPAPKVMVLVLFPGLSLPGCRRSSRLVVDHYLPLPASMVASEAGHRVLVWLLHCSKSHRHPGTSPETDRCCSQPNQSCCSTFCRLCVAPDLLVPSYSWCATRTCQGPARTVRCPDTEGPALDPGWRDSSVQSCSSLMSLRTTVLRTNPCFFVCPSLSPPDTTWWGQLHTTLWTGTRFEEGGAVAVV